MSSYHLAFPYIPPRTSTPILSMDDVSLYIYQLLITLQYIHSHNIIHRNIKRANIIMDDTGHLILIDFEHSVIYNPSISYELIGNPHSRAPEIASAWINPKNRIERPIQKRRCGRSMSRTPCHRMGNGSIFKPITALPSVMEEREPVFIPSHIEVVEHEEKPYDHDSHTDVVSSHVSSSPVENTSQQHMHDDVTSSHVSSSTSVNSSTIDLSHVVPTSISISTCTSSSTSTLSPPLITSSSNNILSQSPEGKNDIVTPISPSSHNNISSHSEEDKNGITAPLTPSSRNISSHSEEGEDTPSSPESPWSHDSDSDSDDDEMETLRIGTFTTAIDMFGVGIVAAELLLTNGDDTYHILPPPCHIDPHHSYTSSRVVDDHIWLSQRMSSYTPYDVFQPYYTTSNQHRMSHEWADLIIHLLDMSPTTRYTAEQALSHPVMKRGYELYQQRMQMYRDEAEHILETSTTTTTTAQSDVTPLSPLYGKRMGADLDIESTPIKKQRVDVDCVRA